LYDYDEEARSDILDWLFLPGLGANLHVLKVSLTKGRSEREEERRGWVARGCGGETD
jgi:hypothetical protein